jgi:hypothetical protein
MGAISSLSKWCIPSLQCQELSFETVGKPFMIMTQKTKSPHSGEPMHAETGYINVRPDSNVTMTACDPTGTWVLYSVYRRSVDAFQLPLSEKCVRRTLIYDNFDQHRIGTRL